MTAGQGSGPEQEPAERPSGWPAGGGGASGSSAPTGQEYPPPGHPPPGQGYPPPGQGYPPPGQGYPPPGQGYPPPGYPPPGQGYPPPGPGYGPYPGGYPEGPPPPPPWGGPPPVQRPVTVRAGLGAYLGSMVLGLVATIVQVTDPDSVTSQLPEGTGMPEGFGSALVVGFAVFGLLWLALRGLFVWFAWRGRNWARIVIWVLGGLQVLGGLLSLAAPTGSGGTAGFLRGLGLFGVLLAGAAVVLLALKPSNEWYRYQRHLQSTGQRG